MQPERKKSGWLGNLALLIGSTAAALLVIEFAFRVVLGHTIVLFPRNHAAAHYGSYVLRTMTPNTSFWHQSIDGQWRFKTNNKGFRDDKDYAYEKPDGTLRVLLLGDSHTAGFEVAQQEVYAKILEDALRKRGIRAEVLNTGVSGFGNAEQLAYLENEGLRYRPDVVVVAFFGNDYSDNARAGLFRLVGGKLQESSRHFAPAVDIIRLTQAIPGLTWLGENSYAYSYLFNAVWDWVKAWSTANAQADIAKTDTPAGAARHEYAVQVGEVSAGEEALAIALLERIAEVGRRNGIYTVLADIPNAVGSGPQGTSPSLTEATRKAVLPSFSRVLDPEQYLGGRPAGQLVHVPHGHRHINAFAHRRLGEALADLIATK